MAEIHYINWANLPCDELGNITKDELDFVSSASSVDRHDEDFIAFLNFIQEPSTETDRLPLLDGDGDKLDISEMDRVEIDSLPSETRKQMLQFGERFREFVKKENLADIENVTTATLNQYLRFFYFKLKKLDGSCYSPASLVCFRAGIQRFLRMVLKRTVDIIDGEEFRSSNGMLRVKVREFHQAGGSTKHYEPIEEGDMDRLAAYFQRATAEVEHDKFLFYVLYCFGERGQEHLKFLTTRDALQLHTDADGKDYYCLPTLPSKNKSADPVKAKAQADNKQARIYDTGKVRRYLDLLPPETKDNHLFPRPLANKPEDGTPAFSTKQNRGQNYLVRFMRNLSEKDGLSKMYTNHCIRVSRICDLEVAGHSLSDIMSITGQTSERTTRRYLSKRRDCSLQATSAAVASALGDHEVHGRELTQQSDLTTVQSSVEIIGINQKNLAAKFSFHNCTFHGCTFD